VAAANIDGLPGSIATVTSGVLWLCCWLSAGVRPHAPAGGPGALAGQPASAGGWPAGTVTSSGPGECVVWGMWCFEPCTTGYQTNVLTMLAAAAAGCWLLLLLLLLSMVCLAARCNKCCLVSYASVVGAQWCAVAVLLAACRRAALYASGALCLIQGKLPQN